MNERLSFAGLFFAIALLFAACALPQTGGEGDFPPSRNDTVIFPRVHFTDVYAFRLDTRSPSGKT